MEHTHDKHHHNNEHQHCTCDHHHDHHGHCGCGHHHEHHNHDSHCGCGHEHINHENHYEKLQLVVGAILFLFGILVEQSFPIISIVCFVITYALLGSEILIQAVKSLTKGHVLDENFLMGIATIAAFIIGAYGEAVGVMLFFRVGEFFEHTAVKKSRNQIMEAVDMRPETVY